MDNTRNASLPQGFKPVKRAQRPAIDTSTANTQPRATQLPLCEGDLGIDAQGEAQRASHTDTNESETTAETHRNDASKQPATNLTIFPTWRNLDRELAAVEWLRKPWLPRGMLTVVVGEADCGKSALGLALVGAVVRGDPWPDGTPGPGYGKVVWAETEEAQQINLDRAKAWGLPLEKIIVPSTRGLFADPRLDMKAAWSDLELAAQQPSVELVMVDSLRGAHRGDENSSQIVDLLTGLTSLARDARVALVLIHHLRKESMLDVRDKITLDRIRGSSAIGATPRVIWAIDRPNVMAPDHVRLYQIKNNLARFPDDLGFEITDTGVVYTTAPATLQPQSQHERARDLLITLLAQGPVPASEILEEAEAAGVSKNTLNRAKTALKVQSVRRDDKWWWEFPNPQGANGI